MASARQRRRRGALRAARGAWRRAVRGRFRRRVCGCLSRHVGHRIRNALPQSTALDRDAAPRRRRAFGRRHAAWERRDAGRRALRCGGRRADRRRAFWAVAVGGVAGAFLDSLLGATLQALRWCPLARARAKRTCTRAERRRCCAGVWMDRKRCRQFRWHAARVASALRAARVSVHVERRR